MRTTVRSLSTAAVLLALGVTGLQAQAHVVLGLGGGIVVPTKGDNSFGPDVSSPGYHLQGLVGISPGKGRVTARLDGEFGRVSYAETTSGVRPRDELVVLNGDLVLHGASRGSVRPYLLAGPTWGHFTYRSGVAAISESGTSGLGFNGGAGLNFGQDAKAWLFLESRYIHTKEHAFFTVAAGLRFRLGRARGAR